MLRPMVGVLAAGLLIWTAGSTGTAFGQAKGGGGSPGGGGGLGGGLSSGGGLGSSGGGLGSSGGLGGSSGGLGGSSSSSSSRTGTSGASGQNNIGSNSPLGPYYGNPLAIGFPASGTSASNASQYQRAFPEQLSFGTPTYGTANVQQRTTTTTTGLGATATSGLSGSGASSGTATLSPSTPFPGASTAGMRRAPPYVTVPVFDMPARLPASEVRSDLQQMIDRSTRLPSRQNIRVSVDGQVVILRGRVRNERERRLAEACVRLTPGVRTVRNLLEPETK